MITNPWIIIPLSWGISLLPLKLAVNDGYTWIAIVVLAMIPIVVAGILETSKVFPKNIFFYENKEEFPNFWVRNKDSILTAIITAIILAGLGL